jgi:hypothetical protein
VPNPVQRYAIGDRTRRLVHEPDGSLRIDVQQTAPDEPANWLPSPPGNFYLMLRLFAPDVEAFGGWDPPPVERVGFAGRTAGGVHSPVRTAGPAR